MATPALTILDGNGTARTLAALQDASGNFLYSVTQDNAQATYRAASIFTPFATSPVTYISIIGSATKTVRVKRIGLWMVATANASVGLSLSRGTALGTGGTAVTPTVQKLDSRTSAAATAVVKHYTTAAQSAATGTSLTSFLATMNLTGNLVAETVQIFAPQPINMLFPEAGTPTGQSLVLSGTGDILEVQMLLGQSGGANGPPAMQLGYAVEWVEDAS